MRELWKRTDGIATMELITLGHAIRRVVQKAPKSLREEWLSAVRGDRIGDRIGALWELLAASLFDSPNHPVSLPKAGNPGFDFTVTVPSGARIRVSCKAVMPSETERRIREFGREIHWGLQYSLPAGARLAVALYKVPAEPMHCDIDAVLAAILKCIPRGPGTFKIPGWMLQLTNLASTQGLTFFEGGHSHTVLVAMAHEQAEQARYIDPLRKKAFSQLAKHCAAVSTNEINIVLLKVPQAVHAEEAEAKVRALLDSSTAPVSAIYLYRTLVCADHSTTTWYLSHEFREIKNPYATVPLDRAIQKNSIQLTFPIGRFEPAEPRQTLVIGDKPMTIRDSHVYVAGDHHFTAPEGTSTRFIGLPGHSYSCTFRASDQLRHQRIVEAPDLDLVVV